MIVRLAGGLGNQFFQYAFGRAYEMETGEKVCFDTWSFYRDKLRKYELNEYQIKKGSLKILKRLVCNIIWEMKTHVGIPVWLEKTVKMEYEKKVYELQTEFIPNSYVVGFFQNEAYFKKYSDVIKKELCYRGELSISERELIQKVRLHQSVAMHIRRTDYITGYGKSVYENISRTYYTTAIDFLKKKLGSDIVVYVFSDDIQWCKREYSDIEGLVFIDEKVSKSHLVDMELMRNCKHFIIANSTFSWWGAWLSDYEEKTVIAPKKWLIDEENNQKLVSALLKQYILI